MWVLRVYSRTRAPRDVFEHLWRWVVQFVRFLHYDLNPLVATDEMWSIEYDENVV